MLSEQFSLLERVCVIACRFSRVCHSFSLDVCRPRLAPRLVGAMDDDCDFALMIDDIDVPEAEAKAADMSKKARVEL